ncbi:MAG: ABC transporter ATP-binding protein [Cyclobacteriaceae bacterium]|nr:ABC transporter ATP-binding protein [Cyclobacteriaceae bacterium]
MISIKELSKSYGKLSVLKSVTLDFVKGNSYAIIGPNGSGKTTLIKSILGLVIPNSGAIEVKGHSIQNDWSYRRDIGYMPQIGHYPDQMRIGQLFDMVKDLRSDFMNADDDLMREFKLNEVKDKRMHTLSGGTRQKVSAALAFLFHPPILILDEPTAGLDPMAAEALKEKIAVERNNNRTFLITSHVLSDLDELTTEMVYLEEGRVLFHDSIELLKEATGEIKLARAVATIMRDKKNSNQHV